MSMCVIETQLDQQSPEAESPDMGLNGNAAQPPSRIAVRARQRLPTNRCDRNYPLALHHGNVQRRLFIVAIKSAGLRGAIQQDRPP